MTMTLIDYVAAGAGAVITLLIGGAVLYWIDQEWRDLRRRRPPVARPVQPTPPKPREDPLPPPAEHPR